MKTYTRPLSVAALALAFTLPTYAAAAKSSLTSELVKSMNAPAKAVNPTAEQLAAQYPALALLPQEAADFVSICDISGLAELMGGAPGQSPFAGIDSVALGSARGNVKLYPALLAFIEKSQQAPALDGDEGGMQSPGEAAFIELLATTPALEPVYAVITSPDGQEEFLETLAAQMNGITIPASDLPDGFKGGELDWEKSGLPADMQAALQKRSLHLLTQQVGNALVIVACEDPAQVKPLPATPAASALGKAAKSLKAGAAGQAPVLALHLSADTLKAFSKTGSASMAEREAALKEADNTSNPLIAKCLRELVELCEAASGMPPTKPGVLQVWRDGKGLSVEASFDAQGASFKPGKFRLAAMGNSPSTILYAENTPFCLPEGLPSMPHYFKVMSDGILAAASVGNDISTAALPMACEVSSAIETMLSGMEGNAAIIVDNKGKVPAALGGDGTGAFPRIGVYAGVEDRAKLSEGWDKLMESLTEAGMDPDEMPVESKSSGKVTRHSIDNPMFTKDFTPNVLLTDKHLAFGTAPALNVQMLKAVGKSKTATSGKGSVFVLRLKPAAACLEGADAGAAMAGGAAAQCIDNVHGTTTVENGAYSIRLRIDFTDEVAK